jgi:hypothetical protein
MPRPADLSPSAVTIAPHHVPPSLNSRDRIGMCIGRTCDVQQKTLIRPGISDIDRTAEAASAFLIGRAKRLWRNFSETGDGLP